MRVRTLLLIVVMSLGSVDIGQASAWSHYSRKSLDWYSSDEAKSVAANVLAWQTEYGDWPNDIDSSDPYDEDRDREKGTFDDRHTTGDIRFLARMYAATKEVTYRDAALRGIDLLLNAQYPNGGFPQDAHQRRTYQKNITFNDYVMVNILELLRDMATKDEFRFVTSRDRRRAERGLQSGIECILKCQVTIDGQPTIWPAQCDEVTFEPTAARIFEPPALTTAESADVIKFLMSVEQPSAEIVRAIESGVDWFEAYEIRGLKLERNQGDTRVVRDAGADNLWARFYSVGAQEPMFIGRDGIIRDSLAEIDHERRNGYAWYGDWGESLKNDLEDWKSEIVGIDD